MKKKVKASVKLFGATMALGLSTLGASAISSHLTPESIFSISELPANALLLSHDGEAKCGEGKCGEGKCGEGKCGEGKCGEGHNHDDEAKCGEGKCGEGKGHSHDDEAKCGEGKCGEGKCGEEKKAK